MRHGIQAPSRAAKIAVVLAMPVTVLTLSTGASSAAAAPADGGVYTLASGSSGKCVDVTGASADN
ncbi:hypothetical protein, partial [Nonomuraea sp. NPDC003201]